MKQPKQRQQSSHSLHTESPSTWHVLAEFSLSSVLGVEIVLAQMIAVSRAMNLPAICCERLALAVTKIFNTVTADATQHQKLVIRILTPAAIIVTDLLQYEQGWGFFLVEKRANDNHIYQTCQEIELFLYFEGGDYDN